MPFFHTSPFEDLVAQATSETNETDNWSLIMDICDKVVNYEDGPKYCLQAINHRLYNSVPRVVMQALTLLDACIINCGKRFQLEVSSRTFVSTLPKLLQKMHPSTAVRFKQLIKKWAEKEFKDDPELGLMPSMYYKLKSEKVDFPEEIVEKKQCSPVPINPDAVSSQEEEEDMIKAIELSLKETKQCEYRIDSIEKIETESLKTEPLKVRAIYDFEAAEDNELTIKTGEIILVTDKSNDSWWKGTNQRGEGYFPVNFVTENLDATAPTPTVEEDQPEKIHEPVVIKAITIDEKKMDMTLNWLNEADPTDEIPDSQEMLQLEEECSSMAPLIEEKLQAIDRKITMLESVNADLVDAIEMFHKLTKAPASSDFWLYYADTMTGPPFHPTQPHPQVEGAENHNAVTHVVSNHVSTITSPTSNPVSELPHTYPPTMLNNVNLPNISNNNTAVPMPLGQPLYVYQPGYPSLNTNRPLHLRGMPTVQSEKLPDSATSNLESASGHPESNATIPNEMNNTSPKVIDASYNNVITTNSVAESHSSTGPLYNQHYNGYTFTVPSAIHLRGTTTPAPSSAYAQGCTVLPMDSTSYNTLGQMCGYVQPPFQAVPNTWHSENRIPYAENINTLNTIATSASSTLEATATISNPC